MELVTGGTGRTVILGGIRYQNATKNMTSGFGAEIVGDRPRYCRTNALIVEGRIMMRTHLVWPVERQGDSGG